MFDDDASSLARLCDTGLSLDSQRVALIQGKRSMTYAELEQRINRVANGLISLGVERFERVLVIFENDIRFPEVLLGIVRAGAVAVPVNFKFKPPQHIDLARDCGSRIVFGSAGTAESVLACLADGVAEVGIVVDADRGPLRSYEDWLASSSPERCDHGSAGSDVCIQAYTSGSTGRPKGVLLAHRGLLRNVQLQAESNRIDENSRVLLSTPLFHMNATAAGLLPCLSQGGSVVILKEFDAERVIDAIETHGCTYTTGVPATYKLILAAARQRTHVDASSLEFIAVGSAPMTRALLDELVQTLPGVDVIEGYGLTESGPIITLNPRGRNKLGTIGPALPGFECKVIDSDGNILPQGEAGELVVRSECNALGYYNRPDAQAERFRDGWVLYRGYRGVRPRRLVHLQGARRRPDERGRRERLPGRSREHPRHSSGSAGRLCRSCPPRGEGPGSGGLRRAQRRVEPRREGTHRLLHDARTRVFPSAPYLLHRRDAALGDRENRPAGS